MAAPACERERNEYAHWSLCMHRHVAWYQRRSIELIVLHCSCRRHGIGVLPLDILIHNVFPRMRVLLM